MPFMLLVFAFQNFTSEILHSADTRNQFDFVILTKKNDMFLEKSIINSASEPNPQRKAYHLRTQHFM